MDAAEQIPGHPFSEIFTAGSPGTIRLQAEISLPEQELRDYNLEPEAPTDPIIITLELSPVASGAQLRVTQFQLGKLDVAKDGSGPIGFAESLRAFIAGTFFLQTEDTTRPFALDRSVSWRRRAGSCRRFNAPTAAGRAVRRAAIERQGAPRSLDLFTQLMRELEPELGPGEFDTAFERETGRADLVFDSGQVAMPIDRLGAGVQRMAALVGSLVLVRASLVGFSEPELGLTPTAQQRLVRAAETLIAAPGGAGQLFFTTHSPILGAGETSFWMSTIDGAPTSEQRPCDGAEALPPLPDRAAAGGPVPGDLDSLIGLVDQLAELEPGALVGAGAPTRSTREKAPEIPPAAAPEAPAPPPGTPPWKWQPDKK